MDKMTEVFVGYAYRKGNEIVITGSPAHDEGLPDEETHNCDFMGCGQLHVLHRFGVDNE